MGLYEQIKNAASSKGYSINRLEKELGFPRSSIRKYNYSKPSAEKLSLIASFLGVSVDSLLSENPDTADAPVQKNEQPGYYTNPETVKKAQELYDDPKYRVLFDAAEGSDPEDLQMAADLLLRLKQTRRD